MDFDPRAVTLVGNRGIFGGVILNMHMHMHWKNMKPLRSSASIVSLANYTITKVKIARLSSGILVQIIVQFNLSGGVIPTIHQH